MSALEPPRQHKPLAAAEVCAGRATPEPEQSNPRITGAVWRLEAVRGRGDAEVARIAEFQRGVVARGQLLEAGLSPSAIKHRLRVGHLHVLYPGVYLFGRPRLESLSHPTAAVIYADRRAVLSHATAARMWGVADGPELPVELTAVSIAVRSRRGLVVHRSRTLSTVDVRLHRGLPVTSPARTLVDEAGSVDEHELEALYAIALRHRLVTTKEVEQAIARAPQSKGVATLRMLTADAAVTRSGYERKLLNLVRAAQLPEPRANAKVAGMEVDLLWPQQKLVVEFDSLAFHSDRGTFENDRLKDQRLLALGHRVMRITARQIDTTPEAVIARLAAALAH